MKGTNATMKKIILAIITCAALALSLTACSPSENYGDYDDSIATSADLFTYKEGNGKITITKYIGTDKKVTIPHKIKGISVIRIGDYAFKNCTSLADITIPNSVKGIGNQAFSNCESLAGITIPDSVTAISYGAFKDCKCDVTYKGKTYTPEQYKELYNAINGG